MVELFAITIFLGLILVILILLLKSMKTLISIRKEELNGTLVESNEEEIKK